MGALISPIRIPELVLTAKLHVYNKIPKIYAQLTDRREIAAMTSNGARSFFTVDFPSN